MSFSAGTMRIIVAMVSVIISRRRPTMSVSHPPSGFANNTAKRVSVFANRKSTGVRTLAAPIDRERERQIVGGIGHRDDAEGLQHRQPVRDQ